MKSPRLAGFFVCAGALSWRVSEPQKWCPLLLETL